MPSLTTMAAVVRSLSTETTKQPETPQSLIADNSTGSPSSGNISLAVALPIIAGFVLIGGCWYGIRQHRKEVRLDDNGVPIIRTMPVARNTKEWDEECLPVYEKAHVKPGEDLPEYTR